MANSVTANFAEYWSRSMQRYLSKMAVYVAIVNREAQAVLKDGDTFNKPYGSDLRVADYTRGSVFTVQDLTTTNEYLTVNLQKVIPFYIDDFDAIQDSYDLRNYYTKRAAIKMMNEMDGLVLAEVANAAYTVDYKDVDSTKTATYGIALSTTTLPLMFSCANRKMDVANVPLNERFAVIDPHCYEIMVQYLAGRSTDLGDKTLENGYKGKFYGIEIYISNASYWTGKVGIATNPSNGDTISLNGVTFTFRTTLGVLPGSVHIASTAALTVDILVAAINTPGTSVAEDTDAGFVALSAANQLKMRSIVATDATTAITFIAKGHGYVPLAETFTADADVWDLNLNIAHYMFGRKGCVSLVEQQRPKVTIKDVSDKLGKNIVTSALYGIKTFLEGVNEMVDVKVNTLTR